jgi:hypothetical protein
MVDAREYGHPLCLNGGLKPVHRVLGPVAATAATGAIALVAFVVWARSVHEPLVDLGLFRHRTYSAVNAATLTLARVRRHRIGEDLGSNA